MFENNKKGKIVIHIEDDDGKINSNMEFQGIAKKIEISLTTLLVNFASLSIEKGKNPKELIDKHLAGILQMLEGGNVI
jgi:hypothetical protein